MKGMGKGAGKGALIGLVLAGAFGILTILGGSGPKDGLAARLFLTFMIAGFYGAIPGAAIGGVIGWIKGRARSGAPSLPPAPRAMPAPVEPTLEPASAPPPGHWIGAVGEALETRATVLSVQPYSDPFATRALRHLHYLRTPSGHVLRWLANDDRGITAGDEVILRGTVKDHTWDSNAQAVTEIWYCRTRRAPRASSAPAKAPSTPAAQPQAPDSPPLTPERQAEIARQREAVRAAAERQAQRQGHSEPAPLAPVRVQPQRPKPEQVDLSDPERVNAILRELDAMPGLEAVTEQVASLAETVRGNERRKRAGLRTAEVGLHLIFSGPPGTAKSTVATAWGRVLCATGLLPTDRTKVAKREDLVGQHVGSTAIKTREVIDSALGGVLFIDEAYSLASNGGTGPDFGAEAVEVLLARMEEERNNLAVIIAGYPDDIERLLASNAGLRSRFEETIRFEPYNPATLVRIAQAIAREADYEWDGEALAALRAAFTRLVAAPPEGWANGREVRKILGQASRAQSRRLGDAEPSRTLTDADARSALTRLYPQAV